MQSLPIDHTPSTLPPPPWAGALARSMACTMVTSWLADSLVPCPRTWRRLLQKGRPTSLLGLHRLHLSNKTSDRGLGRRRTFDAGDPWSDIEVDVEMVPDGADAQGRPRERYGRPRAAVCWCALGS